AARPGRAGSRIYAPVGSHEDLLAYLVRRLLENGANTSFVNRLADEDSPVEEIVADPITQLGAAPYRSAHISRPAEIFPGRKNSPGFLWSDPPVSAPLIEEITASMRAPQSAAPLIAEKLRPGDSRNVLNPADIKRAVGTVVEATKD